MDALGLSDGRVGAAGRASPGGAGLAGSVDAACPQHDDLLFPACLSVHTRNQSGDAHSFKVMVGMMGIESNPNAWNYRLDKTYAASVRCLKD
jgi:hypothetical protein